MDLTLSESNDHKTLMSQDEVSDAFIKSKYDTAVLI